MITSPSPPRRNAITGVPQACASAAAIPKGSSQRAGNSTTAARAMACHSTVRGTPGRTVTPGQFRRGPICSRLYPGS